MMDKDRIQLRSFAKLSFVDPFQALNDLKGIQSLLANSDTPEAIKNLRTNTLKSYREMVDASIFCVGLSAMMGHAVEFAYSEEQDYDFVCRWLDGSHENFHCIQLKELPPSTISKAELSSLLNSLTKYSDSRTSVAIKLNRNSAFSPSDIQLAQDFRMGGLWVFGAITPDKETWCLWGDFKTGPINEGSIFQYPR